MGPPKNFLNFLGKCDDRTPAVEKNKSERIYQHEKLFSPNSY